MLGTPKTRKNEQTNKQRKKKKEKKTKKVKKKLGGDAVLLWDLIVLSPCRRVSYCNYQQKNKLKWRTLDRCIDINTKQHT